MRAGPQLHGPLGPNDRFRIRLGIHHGDVVSDGVAIDALVALGNAHFLAVRIARGAKPGLVIEARGFNDQRIVAFPMTDRVSVPRGIRILGKRSPVGPDRAPLVFALEKLQYPAGSLNKLKGERKKQDPRETRKDRIAEWDHSHRGRPCFRSPAARL